jgi:hypothetical protein
MELRVINCFLFLFFLNKQESGSSGESLVHVNVKSTSHMELGQAVVLLLYYSPSNT